MQGEDAVGYANAGNWSAALASASAAQSGDPQLPAYDFLAGVAALHTGDQHLAATLLAKSAAADDFPEAWLDLASARLALGDRDGVQAALNQAMRVGLQQPSVAFGVGHLELQLGDTSAAVDAFAAAVESTPTLARDPYFGPAGPGAGVLDAVLAAATRTGDRRAGTACC